MCMLWARGYLHRMVLDFYQHKELCFTSLPKPSIWSAEIMKMGRNCGILLGPRSIREGGGIGPVKPARMVFREFSLTYNMIGCVIHSALPSPWQWCHHVLLSRTEQPLHVKAAPCSGCTAHCGTTSLLNIELFPTLTTPTGTPPCEKTTNFKA